MTDTTIDQPATDLGREQRTGTARIYLLLRFVVFSTAILLSMWLLGGVLTVIFAAALLGVILHGLASMLQRYVGLPSWAALTLVVLLITGILAGLGFQAGPKLLDQGRQLRDALSGQAQAIQDWLSGRDWGRFVLEQVPAFLGGNSQKGVPNIPTGFAGSILGVVSSVIDALGTLAVIVIAAIYLAAAPSTYANGTLRLVTPAQRPQARRHLLAASHALWSWSAGQAVDMVVVGCLCGLGLWLIGVPLALVLGVVAGLTNFVPYIGAIGGAVPAVLLAFSVGSTAGVETIVLFLVVQAFEGNVMAPYIQKRAVNLPPALTILSQTTFGAILGLPGLIFATPITAMLLAIGAEATSPLESDVRI